MVYPGYLLNPGDMFQVEIEKVLTATGRQRPSLKSKAAKKNDATEEQDAEPAVEELAEGEAAGAAEDAAAASEVAEEGVEENEMDDAMLKERELARLKAIYAQAKTVLSGGKDELSAKRKQEIRALVKNVKREMSSVLRRDSSIKESQSTVDNLVTLMSRLELSTAESQKARAAKKAEQDSEAEWEDYTLDKAGLASLREDNLVKKHDGLLENPVDKTKPYMTPWRPRPFMAPFAFIPPYLEVNQNICSAVYLRHPVARKGSAEVPTPFPPDVGQLAFNWYLRRR